MREDQWLSSIDPNKMFKFLWKGGGDKFYRRDHKSRLWCLAVVKSTIDDGNRAYEDIMWHYTDWIWQTKKGEALTAREVVALWVDPGEKECAQEKKADLIREIFGNPFDPPHRCEETQCNWCEKILPSWRSPDVLKLACTVALDWDFSELYPLCDALEEAGCDNYQILHHLRYGKNHVRGCWCLDLILGAEYDQLEQALLVASEGDKGRAVEEWIASRTFR